MSLATLTARVEDTDKAIFDDFCSSVGLSASGAINLFVKAVIRERRIPFEIRQDDPFYDPVNQAHLILSIRQLEQGKGTVHELIEAEDE